MKLFAAVVGVEPPLQLYVPPPVAVALSEVVVHVSTVVAGGVIPAVGGVNCAVILKDELALEVQEPLLVVTV